MRNPTELELKVAKAIDDACRLGGLFVAKEANTIQNIGITPVALLAMLLSSDKTITERSDGPQS